MIQVRSAIEGDFESIWPIFHRVVSEGGTYPYAPETTSDEARSYWMAPPAKTYVALDRDRIFGTYFLKPNQPGLGSHVANAGFMVDPDRQGHGGTRAHGSAPDRVPGHAVQPGGAYKRCGVGALGKSRVRYRRDAARSVSSFGTWICRCLCDVQIPGWSQINGAISWVL